MSIFLLLGLVWSLIAIIVLGKLFECLDSSPRIWSLIFSILCLHALVLLAITLLWIMSVARICCFVEAY
jgi:hypothetical protein